MDSNLYFKNFKVCVFVVITVFMNVAVLANGSCKSPPIGPGTYIVGPGSPSGYTTTIAAAIATINAGGGITGPVVLELNAAYGPTSETLSAITGTNATNTVTIRPSLLAISKSFTSASTTPTFQIVGGKYFIIDGRAGGLGTTKGITIDNTNTAGSAISFTGDGSNNIISYCILKGAATSTTGGVVVFGNASINGNDNNAITNCDITSSSSFAINGVYSRGQNAVRSNDANTISNCNIYDIFNASQKSIGILMEANNVGWIISSNSFYQTVVRTTSAAWEAIEINNKTSGNGFNILNNFIGGTAPLAASGTMSFTHTGSGYFSGISVYGFSGTANVVSGNTIKNLSITCNQRNLHYGIYHSDGSVNILNNTIGDLTTTGSIVFNSSAPTVSFISPAFAAICGGGGSTSGSIGGNVNIQNNNIGSINSNATGTGANEFRGIFYQVTNTLTAVSIVDISGNTVGGTVANSLSNTGNGATVGIVINSSYATGGAVHTVKNNTVQNLNSNNITLPAQGSLEGITTQGIANKDAAYIVENNTIKDLTANNAYTMVGFKTSATIAPQLITKNKIFNLKNISSLVGSNVVGIELGYDFITITPVPSVTPSVLSNNIISNIEMSAATPAAGSVAWGLSAYAGRFNIFNNMVSMGYGIGNTDIIKPYEIIGIANNGVGASKPSYYNIYYNTVQVGGTGAVAGSPDSKCYYGNNFGTVDLKNNIFYNSRSNAGGTTTHYSLLYTNNGTTTSDYNVLSAVGTGGIVAGYFNGTTTNYATTDALFAARAIDDNSFSAPVKFENNASNLRTVPSPDVTNFFIANEALPIAGFTTDIDGNTRNTFFPDMGCYEFKGTGCWIGQTSSAWDNTTAVAGNWDDGLVPPSSWDVKVFPNVDPAITQPVIVSAAGIATVKDLYLRTTTRGTTNKSLVTVNTGILQIYGAIKFRKNAVYNAAIDAVLGTIDMKGFTGTQFLSPKWFVKTEIETLTNSNTAGLTIAAPTVVDTMLISKALNYGAGTTGSTITTNDNLTLLSRVTGTANFGDITGNFITGKVTVERYLPTTRKWRHLAWPTTSTQTATQSWMENNTTPNGNIKPGYGTIVTDEKASWNTFNFDSRSISGPSVKYYDPASDKQIGIPDTRSYAMNTQSAYYNYVRGDRSCLPSPITLSSTTLRSTGTLKTGNIVFPVTANLYAAIGNPYASAFDVRKLDTANLTSIIYVWDPKLTGAYGLGAYQMLYMSGADYRVMPGGGTYGALNSLVDTLESGQAFFVKAKGGNGSVTFKEAVKNSSARNMSRMFTDTALFAVLSLVDPTENTIVDGAMAMFGESFSNGIDYDDATKLLNTGENMSFKRNTGIFAIEKRGNIVQDDTLFLNISSYRAHKYKLDLTLYNLNNQGRKGYLIDKYLHNETALNLNNINSVEFDVTSNAGSSAPDRLIILFKQIAIPQIKIIALKAERETTNAEALTWNVEKEKDMDYYLIEISSDGENFTALANQIPAANNVENVSYHFLYATAAASKIYYRITGVAVSGYKIYSNIVNVYELNKMSANPSISIYPNPAPNGNISIYFKNKMFGDYTVQVANSAGQIILNEKLTINNFNCIKHLDVKVASGLYTCTITDENYKTENITFIIK